MKTSNGDYGNFYQTKSLSQPLKGLDNLGNTCYINAALQLLFQCFAFHAVSCSYQVKDLLSALQKEGGRENVKRLKRMLDELLPMCEGYEQQDCYLFLINFVDLLQTKFKLSCGDLSIKAVNRLKCPFGHRFQKEQRMLNLTLSAGYDVQQLLDLSLRQESLSFNCDKCAKTVMGSTKTQLLTLPKYLLLKLNIFRSERGYLERTHCEAAIPSTLELSKLKFRLIAIIQHFGQLGRGHYTASVKKGAEWFQVSDERVRMREEPRKSKNVYMLLYQK